MCRSLRPSGKYKCHRHRSDPSDIHQDHQHCGDEPYNEAEKVYAQNSQWLLHEAFCLFGEADQFKPYEKHHSTVKDACELGERLNVENLILYHTEDKNILKRQEMYLAEGRKFYHGNLYVPEDLDVIEL